MNIHLGSLNQFTAQEVFDFVAAKWLPQQAKAYDHRGHRYRYYIFKCPAGFLIADNEWNSNWEYKTWETLVESRVVPPTHKELICALQAAHDKYWFIHKVAALNEVAAKFGLVGVGGQLLKIA